MRGSDPARHTFVSGAPGAWEITEGPLGFANLTTTVVGDAVVPFDMVVGAPTDEFIGFNLNGSMILTAVPLPAAFWLLGSGLMGLVALSRRKGR